jgi:hypothetical protein
MDKNNQKSAKQKERVPLRAPAADLADALHKKNNPRSMVNH